MTNYYCEHGTRHVYAVINECFEHHQHQSHKQSQTENEGTNAAETRDREMCEGKMHFKIMIIILIDDY